MMLNSIRTVLDQRGELTFRELCCELNCFTPTEIQDVRDGVRYTKASQLGEEVCISSSTLLFPRSVGLHGGDGVPRSPARHGIPYIS